MVSRLILAAPALMLATCATTGNLCSVGPFIPDHGFEQRLTDSEKMQALVWNESGAEICGWTTE